MQGASAYRRSQVETADRLELVRLTHAALAKALAQAREAILDGDLAREAERTARAMEAIVELASSLDMERGGEIARNLASLYAYLMQRLAHGLCSASTEAVDEALRIVEVLRSAWDELGAGGRPNPALPERARAGEPVRAAAGAV